jgi:glycosyltransferase involved in cell wall biosynthesis
MRRYSEADVMRVLFLSWWWPYPADNGSKIRIYNLLKYLGQRYRVTLFSFAEADEARLEEVEHLRQFCERVEVIAKPHYNPGALKATLGYLSRWPRSLVDVYSPEMEALISSTVAEPYDLVIASQLQTLRYLDLVPHSPAILDDIEIAIFRDRVTQAVGTQSRLRAQLTLSKVENALRDLLTRGVTFSVVSPEEQRLMQSFAPADARIVVTPNGVDTEFHIPNADVSVEPDSLIYTGALTYDANLDAVRYFVREVWPQVRAHHPQARFSVTGDTTGVDLTGIIGVPGVRLTGHLPSVTEALRRSHALIVPLRQGGGTRLKILEAMALGVPVISTYKGAEGLSVTDEKNILLADTPVELAAAVNRLFRDRALADHLRTNARTLVEVEYDWRVIGDGLMREIEQMPSRRAQVPT